MSVERFVPSIADQGTRQSREVNILVLRQYELGNQQVRQNSFVEIVAKLEPRVRLSADKFFHLERDVAKAGCEKRIFGCALEGETG